MTDSGLDFELINSADQLSELCARMATASHLFVDTEFLRERTYRPQLCLVQVSDGEHAAVIDPLAFDASPGMRTLLCQPHQTKVFHAASQDTEVLYYSLGEIPAPLYDTQSAASLLGHGDQIGYAGLIERILGIVLPKAYTRLDWSKRPLPDAALEYAAADVVHLADAWPKLQQSLADCGRSDWLNGEFDAYADPSRFEQQAQNGWRRLKGIYRMRSQQRQAAGRLANWREEQAIARDLPRKWVLKDDVIMDLVRRRPQSISEMADIRDLGDKTLSRDGEALLQALNSSETIEALNDRPERKLPAGAEPVVDLLWAVLRSTCAQADISTAAVCTRKELEALVAGERDLSLLKGWRAHVAGQAMLSVLEGRQVRVSDGSKLVLEQAD